MRTENTILVVKGIYVHLRDGAKNNIWQYYFTIDKVPYRGTTGTNDLDEAKMVAIQKFQNAKTIPNGCSPRCSASAQSAADWMDTRQTKGVSVVSMETKGQGASDLLKGLVLPTPAMDDRALKMEGGTLAFD